MASRLALLLLLAACARTKVEVAAVEQHGAKDEFAEMDFWDEVAKQDAICNSDAVHALMLSFDVKDPGDYGARLAECRKRGWIRENDELPANETARVGWIAKAVCIEAGIKGGLTMRVLGPRERYAVHELNYRGWLPEMSTRQTLSGAKLIALLGSAEDHLADTKDTPKEDL